MSAIKNAIQCMHKFHECYKNGNKTDPTAVENSINALPESQRNFLLITSKMNDFEKVYPVSDVLSDKYTLGDLVMAYHFYVIESKSEKKDTILLQQADYFYEL